MLDRAADVTDRMNLREPEFFIWQGDHLEAPVRAGRLTRTRAQLMNDPTAAALHDEAIREFQDVGMPFEVR